MSGQDNQANMTKQVTQSEAWGHMTKFNSPSSIYVGEEISVSNLDSTYTSFTTIKEFSQ